MFAAIALLLAVVGIYAVITYTAAQRGHEMGIRAALGASAAHLRWLIIQGALGMTLIGLLLGLVGTVPVTGFMASILYGVDADDPLDDRRCRPLLLFAVAGLACVVPAWRITENEPMDALRRQ